MLTDRQIENRLSALRDLDAEIAQLEKAREAKRKELIAELNERKVDSIYTENGAEVRYTLIVGHRFDAKSFQAEHGDLYEAFTRVNLQNRFSYKPRA